eukprot:1147375-Amphidinium_carterae.2
MCCATRAYLQPWSAIIRVREPQSPYLGCSIAKMSVLCFALSTRPFTRVFSFASCQVIFSQSRTPTCAHHLALGIAEAY